MIVGYCWVITTIRHYAHILYIFGSFVTWGVVILLGAELLALVVGMGTQVLSTSAPRVVGFIYIYIHIYIYENIFLLSLCCGIIV